MSIEARIAEARKFKLLPVQLAFDYIVHTLKTNRRQNIPVSQSMLFKDCRAQGFTNADVWHVLRSLELADAVQFTPGNIGHTTRMQIVWLGGDE